MKRNTITALSLAAALLSAPAFAAPKMSVDMKAEKDVVVVEKHHLPRVLNDGRGVGGDEVFAFVHAQHQRTAAARGNELVGFAARDHHNAKGAIHFLQRQAHGLGVAVFHQRAGCLEHGHRLVVILRVLAGAAHRGDDVELAAVDPPVGVSSEEACQRSLLLPFIKGSAPAGAVPCDPSARLQSGAQDASSGGGDAAAQDPSTQRSWFRRLFD